jgi:hypothetical protein
MIQYFQNLLRTFPSHNIRAKWQTQQLKQLVRNLPANHAIAITIIPKTTVARIKPKSFSISALVLDRDSHIKPDSEAGGLIWVEG